MRRFWKVPLVVGATVVLILLAGLWWWRTRGISQVSYATASVVRGDVVATISATGTIEPLESVDVGAQVAGRVVAFGTDVHGKTIDYGSAVRKDAVLARIDDSVYAADLATAKAQLDQAQAGKLSADANLKQMQAKLGLAQAQWKQAEALYQASPRLLAQSDYDIAKANYEVAQSDVSVGQAAVAQAKSSIVQAQAGLQKAQQNLDFCIIKSPVSGIIIDRRVNIGQTVVASLNAPSLFLIANDLSKMQIWAAVNEGDVGRIRPGMPVTFTVDGFPGQIFEGNVEEVRLNATMNQNVVLYTVVVNIDNSQKRLLPYLTANVRFILKNETNVLLVPNAALRWTPSSMAEVTPNARKEFSMDPPTGNNQELPSSSRIVWSKDGDFVRPLEVTVGISDGINTAVTGKDLRVGEEVVTGDEAGASAQGAVNSPFLPNRRH
jgi:HlyD family secretion protein